MKLGLPYPTQSKKIPPPGPRGLPIVGMLPFIGDRIEQTFTNLAKKYGDIYQIPMGFQTVVVLNGLETIRQAALDKQGDFAGRPRLYFLETVVRGLSVNAGDYGPRWKKHREIAGKAMHMFLCQPGVIEQQVTEQAVELANTLLSYKGQPFDLESDIGLAVGDVIFRILFGERGRDDEDFVEMVKLLKVFAIIALDITKADFLPPTRIFYRKSFQQFNYTSALLERLILKKIKEHKDSHDPESLRDMTDALLKVFSELDESEKQTLGLTEDQVVSATLQESFGGGSEPIASVLNWAVLYMIAYPDIQAQIQQELDEVVGRERQLRYEDRKRLPFTEACIHEIMRHATLQPLGLPHYTTTDTTINGYFIPKNTMVFFNLYGLTRDERYWKEPEKFNPRRFLSESGKIRTDLLDRYYQFGIGKRRCIGENLSRLEIFMFLTNLMQKCKFESVAGEKLSFDGIPGFFVNPEKYKVIVKPRF